MFLYSGSDLFDLELITAADEGSSDNLIQKPSTAPGSSGQQVSTRKRLHSEEREKKQLKRQRVDKDVGSSGLPEQVDGTHSDGPQLPVEADSVLSSPPAPHHSIAPYQQPLKEKSDGTKSSDRGDKPSHEQQPSLTQKIPKAFLAYGIPSRIASIIQSYWYVRGRQKVVEKKMSEQK